MIPFVAVLAALSLTSVKGLSVVPVADRTEVVVEVDGSVTVEEFTLTDPLRLVVDITGATNRLARESFPDIGRGGVLALRVGQFRPDVVRVVVELAEPVAYSVSAEDGRVRISFPNPGGPFEPWHSEGPPMAGLEGVAAPELASVQAAPPPPARPQEQPRITVYFQNTPILDVLATFAEFADRSIVAGAGVQANITADIRNQPWDVALEAMLASNGLAARELESGIIRVDKLEELRKLEEQEDLVTQQFRVHYVNADSLVKVVEGLLSNRGSVTVNRSTNSLVVTDGRSALERLAPRIAEFDARTPQVTIAAKIIFIERTALEELGVAYDLKDSQGSQLNTLVQGFKDEDGDGILEPDEQTEENVILLGGNSIAALANAQQLVSGPALQLVSSLVLGRHSLITFITALESMSLSDVQAAPVVTTLDHREASIQVGEETPIRVVDVGAASQGAGAGVGGGLVFPRANVQMKETGIILEVTPHVTGNQVLLEIRAERSNVALAPGDIGITFNTQEAQTQVLVNDGETAVIGGLTLTDKVEARTGIPILMDLPLIGALFRKTSERVNKRDLLIMVTPHIIRGDEA